MEVNLGNNVHSIAIKPSEILDMLKEQKILTGDMEFFCSLLHSNATSTTCTIRQSWVSAG